MQGSPVAGNSFHSSAMQTLAFRENRMDFRLGQSIKSNKRQQSSYRPGRETNTARSHHRAHIAFYDSHRDIDSRSSIATLTFRLGQESWLYSPYSTPLVGHLETN